MQCLRILTVQKGAVSKRGLAVETKGDALLFLRQPSLSEKTALVVSHSLCLLRPVMQLHWTSCLWDQTVLSRAWLQTHNGG